MSSSLLATGCRLSVADWGGGMTAGCTAGPALTRAMDGRIVRRGIIGSCQSAATFEIAKYFGHESDSCLDLTLTCCTLAMLERHAAAAASGSFSGSLSLVQGGICRGGDGGCVLVTGTPDPPTGI